MSREIETPTIDPTADPNLAPSGEPSLETPLTEPPKEPAIDPEKQMMMDTLRFQNRRIAELEAGRTVTPTPEPPKSRDIEVERQEFFNDPIGAMRREMAATIAPLQKIADTIAGGTKFDTLMDQIKNDPRFTKMWNRTLEEYVVREGKNINPAVLNFDTLGFVVLTGIGLQAAGMLAGGGVAPEPRTPEVPVAPTPPYMRPSAPTPPTPRSDAPKFKPLDENEKRILREYNAKVPLEKRMTDQQYRQWSGIASNEVATTQFDAPPVRK